MWRAPVPFLSGTKLKHFENRRPGAMTPVLLDKMRWNEGKCCFRLLLDVICNTPPPPPLPPSPSTAISSCLHHSPLSRLASSTDRSRPLSSPPPLSSRRVVPRPRLSRLRRRSEGTAASPHPSWSRRRRGKIPSIVVVLRSDDDATRRPRQRDNIAAPAIVTAARRTSILAKNAAAALLLARGTLFPTAAVTDAVPPPPPRLATRPPQQHVDCHFPFKA